MTTMATGRTCAIALLALLVCACGKGDAPGARGGQGDAEGALPAPERAGGSVTGMPEGRRGAQPVVLGAAPDAPLPEIAMPPPGANPETGMAPELGPDGQPLSPAPTVQGEPTADDAVAVVRDYYAAINARDFGRAYALWAGGGGASGQSPQEFGDGFADTAGVSVELQAPGQVEGAAGSRFVEVPVAITATQRDGSVRRYVGAYALRRAVVDGASAEQRSWRIASADLREVGQ